MTRKGYISALGLISFCVGILMPLIIAVMYYG
jgi:hypothetical protein